MSSQGAFYIFLFILWLLLKKTNWNRYICFFDFFSLRFLGQAVDVFVIDTLESCVTVKYCIFLF